MLLIRLKSTHWTAAVDYSCRKSSISIEHSSCKYSTVSQLTVVLPQSWSLANSPCRPPGTLPNLPTSALSPQTPNYPVYSRHRHRSGLPNGRNMFRLQPSGLWGRRTLPSLLSPLPWIQLAVAAFSTGLPATRLFASRHVSRRPTIPRKCRHKFGRLASERRQTISQTVGTGGFKQQMWRIL